MDYIKLTNDHLKIEEIINLVSDESCGAINCFVGTTRDNFEGKKVIQLEYEAYTEMAEKEIKKISDNVRKKWNLKNVAVYHRLGVVGIKEASVVIAVSSVHRNDALCAVSFIINTLKSSVPIWKKEVYEGDSAWKINKECSWLNTDNLLPNSNLPKQQQSEGFNSDSKYIKQEEKIEMVDPSFVQIVAPKEEIERRIEAFQKMKREELNILNIQEFCTRVLDADEENSCARTSAVILRSKGSSTHLKLTKVKNEWGPQTDGIDPGSLPVSFIEKEGINTSDKFTKIKSEYQPDSQDNKVAEKRKLPQGIEERISNMEDHLDIKLNDQKTPTVFERLKELENRILYLEGLSPEYFKLNFKSNDSKSSQNSYKVKKSDSDDEDYVMLNAVDAKLFELKKMMKSKQLNKLKY